VRVEPGRADNPESTPPTAPDATDEPELDVDEVVTPDDDVAEPLHFEIASYPADYTVKVLVEKWRAEQLVIPDFQRAYVWNQPQASKLIESFLLGLPVPQVFLYKDRASQRLLVVDGHQRLSTIVQFYTGQFKDTRIFRLVGVQDRWLGKRYSDLDDADKLRLDDSTLRSIVIQQLSPDDHDSIYLIFERLNAGGVKLNPMEIRKTVYHGAAIELIEELNLDPNWRRLIGLPKPDPRLKDLELVGRVLALENAWREYTKPMKAFLTTFMKGLVKVDDAARADIARRFTEATETAAKGLGDRPFHLRGPLNIAALDATLASAMEARVTDPDVVAACFSTLVDDKEFQKTIYFNTSDAQVVKSRFQSMLDCLTSAS
jgi:hypothetical protein